MRGIVAYGSSRICSKTHGLGDSHAFGIVMHVPLIVAGLLAFSELVGGGCTEVDPPALQDPRPGGIRGASLIPATSSRSSGHGDPCELLMPLSQPLDGVQLSLIGSVIGCPALQAPVGAANGDGEH